VDGVRVGGVEFLVDITLDRVETVRFIDPSEATTRWGSGVDAGVIEVTTTPRS
jgi:hypothetical protein